MKKIAIVFLFVIFTVQIKGQSGKDIAAKIAGAYGIDNFTKVKSIHYVFNVKKGLKGVRREWTWFPAEKIVIAGSYENAIKYNRKNFDKNDPKMKKLDHNFINDNYWLLFPFRLVWDTGVELVSKGKFRSPITKTECERVDAVYKNEGYTPNDVYELYLNGNHEIIEWVYRPGGSKEKAKAVKWDEPEDFDGIKISTSHQNKDGSFRLWFTEIRIEFK